MTDSESDDSRNPSQVGLEKDISPNFADTPHVLFNDGDNEALPLPPTDGGRKAWMFMVGAVMIDSVIWGGFSPSAL
jgi:hypothetical protein